MESYRDMYVKKKNPLWFVPFSSSGKALLDVLVLGSAEQSPPVKDLLLLLGALKHMSCWHAAKITVVTQNTTG